MRRATTVRAQLVGDGGAYANTQLSKFGGRHFQRTALYCRSEKKGVSINLEQSAARTRGSSDEEPHEEPELGNWDACPTTAVVPVERGRDFRR